MSPEARARIAEAQRKRWAKTKSKRDYAREYYRRKHKGKKSRSQAVSAYWAKLKKNPAAYEAEVAKRTKARDANKAKRAAA